MESLNVAARRPVSARLEGLSALRGLACLGIFASHACPRFACMGKCGVSVFLILSGFLMVYGYYGKNRIAGTSALDCIRFSLRKIAGLYLLYMLTNFLKLPFLFGGGDRVAVPHAALLLGLDGLLVQEWLPLRDSSINDVGWYLCVCAFLYALFPVVLRRMERNYSERSARRAIALLFAAQVLLGLCGCAIPSPAYDPHGLWKRDFTAWFIYNFPPARLPDFLIGCNLGYLFLKRRPRAERSERWYARMEVLAALGMAVACLIFARAWRAGDALSDYRRNWWLYTLPFTAVSCAAIYLFALQRGRLSALLTNRATLYLSEISPYMFLIHFIVLQYLLTALRAALGWAAVERWGEIAQLLIGLPVSIACSQLWMKLAARAKIRQNGRI